MLLRYQFTKNMPWGNDGTFGNQLTPEVLKPIFDKAMEKGLNLWDTAFAY